VTAFISASRTAAGKTLEEFVTILGGGDPFGALTLSLELQLDAPTNAAIDRTKAVRAKRAGVKKLLRV
jgi:hypothetical protein